MHRLEGNIGVKRARGVVRGDESRRFGGESQCRISAVDVWARRTRDGAIEPRAVREVCSLAATSFATVGPIALNGCMICNKQVASASQCSSRWPGTSALASQRECAVKTLTVAKEGLEATVCRRVTLEQRATMPLSYGECGYVFRLLCLS